jgi:RND superfamily putative drug exporter
VAAVVIMLLAFGSVVAMGLPILTALAGMGVGFGSSTGSATCSRCPPTPRT